MFDGPQANVGVELSNMEITFLKQYYGLYIYIVQRI